MHTNPNCLKRLSRMLKPAPREFRAGAAPPQPGKFQKQALEVEAQIWKGLSVLPGVAVCPAPFSRSENQNREANYLLPHHPGS